jgi:large subunit ribosomal protein LP0
MLRKKLRAIDACMIMGKNTLMKSALLKMNKKPEEGDSDYEDRKDGWAVNPNVEKICGLLKGNINLIFSNGDLGEVKELLDDEVRPSPAKAGMVAPMDVVIPAGPTGLDPKQTSFFQTLQIQTKIVKAQIEIVAPKQVIFVGERVDSTQAALLDKLKIYPFSYKMEVRKVLQDGSVFDAKVLDLSTEVILNKFKAACKVQASLSLAAAYPTSASAPHSILNAFKNMACVAAMTGYGFKEADALLAAAKNAPAAGAAGAPVA